MAITQAQLDVVEAKIVALEAASFSALGLSIDQEKTLATLKKQFAWMKKQFKTTLAWGESNIRGIDA